MNIVEIIRNKTGLSIIEIARITGLKRDSIYKIEKGINKPSFTTTEKLKASFPDIFSIDLIQIPLFSDALKDKYEQGYFENKENKLLIQFDANILESLDIKDFDKDKLFYIKMVGDTMQPLIAHDDNVLISLEVSKETIRSNRMYLINENGRLSIKRITRENPICDDITIKDDNETSTNYNKYPAKISELPDDFLIGKVIYVGKRIY